VVACCGIDDDNSAKQTPPAAVVVTVDRKTALIYLLRLPQVCDGNILTLCSFFCFRRITLKFLVDGILGMGRLRSRKEGDPAFLRLYSMEFHGKLSMGLIPWNF